MAFAARFPYRRLKAEGFGADGDGVDGGVVLDDDVIERYRAIVRSKLWYARFKRVAIKKRFKLRVPGLRRFLRRRARLVRLSCAKVLRRLKESQSHFGDLFAGNYLFLQVNPTPVKKHLERSAAAAAGERGRGYGVGGHGPSPKVSVHGYAY